MKNAYNDNYTVLDSNKSYFYIIAINCCMSLILAIVFNLLAKIVGVSYESLTTMQWAIYVSIICIPLSYLALYFIYHKRNKIKIFERTNKFNIWLAILSVLIGTICIFAIAPVTNWISFALQKIGMQPSSNLTFVMNEWWQILLGIIGYAVLPAVAEELLFRKVILNGYLSRFTPFASILVTSFMFTFMHGSIHQFFYQIILGLVLTGLMYVTRNVIYPIIMHFVNNCTVVILQVTGGEFLVSGAAMPVSMGWNIALYTIIAIAAGALIFVTLYIINRLNKSSNSLNSSSIIVERNNVSSFVNKQSNLEQIYFISGVVLALVIWITSTVSLF